MNREQIKQIEDRYQKRVPDIIKIPALNIYIVDRRLILTHTEYGLRMDSRHIRKYLPFHLNTWVRCSRLELLLCCGVTVDQVRRESWGESVLYFSTIKVK